MEYSAKSDYQSEYVARTYETLRFSGQLGRYRYRREQTAVGRILDHLPPTQLILDCPIGTGRWSEVLLRRGHHVVGCDVSKAMIEAAQARVAMDPRTHGIFLGDAESLPLPDGAVDFAFCHALTKHLPAEVQQSVLSELVRVATRGVVLSLSIRDGLQGALMSARRVPNANAIRPSTLEEWAKQLQVVVFARERCSTPIGFESSVLILKK